MEIGETYMGVLSLKEGGSKQGNMGMSVLEWPWT